MTWFVSRDWVVVMVLVCWERKAVAVSAADGELASAREVVEKRERVGGREVTRLRRKKAMIVLKGCLEVGIVY